MERSGSVHDRGAIVGWVVFCVLALGLGAPTAAWGGLSFVQQPFADPAEVEAGEAVSLTASAEFPGEEWIGFEWDFTDGTVLRPPIHNGSFASETVSHVFSEPKVYKVRCTAYHGFRGGTFGAGAFKYRRSAIVEVDVLPGLPLTVGVLTIDGEKIERVGERNKETYRVSGNVVVNELISLSNEVIVDLKQVKVTFSGRLQIPTAGPYADVLSFARNLTLDASTGSFASVDLPDIKAEYRINGFEITFTNLKIVGPGVEFDFSFVVPRLSQEPDGDGKFPDPPGPRALVKAEFKQFRVDGVSPYLHTLGETSLTLSNIGVSGTHYGLESLQLGFDLSMERYFGNVLLKLPSDRAIGGSAELKQGQLNQIGFTVGAKVPIWTFAGGLDAVYIRSLSGGLNNLAVIPGTPTVVTFEGGKLDPDTLDVITPGLVLEWGPSVNVLGESIVTPVSLDGAGVFDPFWNLTVGGQLTLFKELFGDFFQLLQARGRYQPRPEGGIWTLQGRLKFDELFDLEGSFTSSLVPQDFYHHATASGSTLIPDGHWASRFVPDATGTVEFVGRREPREKYVAGFSGDAVIPVLGLRAISYQYDLLTGETSLQFPDVFVVESDAPAGGSRHLRAARAPSAVLTGGEGADGMVVRLRHETGAASFDLRLADGTLLTPGTVDGVTAAFAQNPAVPESVYLLASAPDGTYVAEFDDAGLGAWQVDFMVPAPAPEVTVSAPAVDETVARYDPISVDFVPENLPDDSTVRLYLDDDGVWGGGHLFGLADSLDDLSLVGVATDVPTGDYFVVVEVDPPGGLPVSGVAPGKVTVTESLVLVPEKGTLVDGDAEAKDKLKLSGRLELTGTVPASLFEPERDHLSLSLGSEEAPFVVVVPAGDEGWKASRSGALQWRSPAKTTPKIKLNLDAAKGKFKMSASRFDFPGVQQNPLGIDFRFGADEGAAYDTWTEKKPGRFRLR